MSAQFEIRLTEHFDQWLQNLRDRKGRARITRRIERAREGNWGDCRSVGDGVSEMRINYGPGYRVYFGQLGQTVYLLLSGGDKKTQNTDIANAKTAWIRIKEEGYDARKNYN